MLTAIVLRLIGRFDPQRTIGRTIHKAQHALGAFLIAVEGHLLLVFVYPHFYPVIRLIGALIGIDLLHSFQYE